jgi:N-acetylmuramoyl-L-alanine amidase
MDIAEHRLKDIEFRAATHFGGAIVPKFIVVHYTAGGAAEGSYRALENVGLSAHVLLERDGGLIQTVAFDRKAFHAGASFWKGVRFLNNHSIGIEVCNYGWLERRSDGTFQRSSRFGATPVFEPEQVIVSDHKNGWPRDVGWEIFPSEQLRVLQELCQALLRAYPSIKEIVGHDDISPDRKQDPGAAMPLDHLQILADDRDETRFGTWYEVIARSGLNVRAGPGTEHPVVSVLPLGSRVMVAENAGSWFSVDLQNDGAVDGFVHGGFVRLA